MQSFAPDAEAAATRDRWPWFLAYGVILVIVGLIAIYNAVDATLVTTIWVGFLLLFGGVVELFSAFTYPRSIGGRILHVVLGLLYIAAGLSLIFNPISGAITLAVIIAIMLIVDGFLRLWFALTTDAPDRVLNLVLGVIDVLLGAWLWTGIPMTALAIGFYVGFALLIAGISWIMLSFRVKGSAAA